MAGGMTRRGFLTVSSAGGAGLLIGFNLWGCKSSSDDKQAPAPAPTPTKPTIPPPPAAPAEQHEVNAWVRIGSDGSVTVIVSESEMGQGIMTALPMILADELDVDWKTVRAEHAPANDTLYGRQSTGGSSSIRQGYANTRNAGAAAREMLIAAAAQEWGVPAGELAAANGEITHAKTKKRATYSALAVSASKMPPPKQPKLKDAAKFRYIGKSMPRLDVHTKVDGSAKYGIDVRVPGMLFAQVEHCPIFGGKLKSFDATEANKVEGVRDVVEVATGVAVVANHFWAAKKGREALKIEWDDGGYGSLDSAGVTEKCKAVLGKGVEVRKDGDIRSAMSKATATVEAVYEVPYLAHAPMEPLSCTANVTEDSCEVWVSTQAPFYAQMAASQASGLPKEKIQIHTMMLGGGFGRRSQTDFILDAVHLSKKIGKPVQSVWSREDDIRGGQYRPVGYNRLRGSVADGTITAWEHDIASPSILQRLGPLRGGKDATNIEGAENIPYSIENVRVNWANPDLPVSLWFWRSVGSSQNAYITECFFDELAKAAKKDPYELRRSLLGKKPRHLRVLETAADKAGWGSTLPQGRARGIAVHESFGSFVAQVAEVSIDKGRPRVHRVVCAVDCGDVINPDTVEAQMDSGIAYGLSAALYGEISLKGGRAVQGNFNDYKVVRMDEMPRCETHIVTRGDPHGGIGEVSLPPIAPAVCNALLVLTGKPVRRLPIKLS